VKANEELAMTHKQWAFGKLLREKRTGKGFSLRKFAKLVGVSAVYISRVERGNITPPTADRAKRMAELLGENPDEWIVLVGRVPQDLPGIIQKEPVAMLELLRAASGLTAEQLRELSEQARKLKEHGN
jgi:transcriptional regulator with XRE-family HTH domain